MDVYLSAKDHHNAVFTTAILFTVLTGIVLSLRILSRPLFKIKYGLEDWFILAAALVFWVQAALQIYASANAKWAASIMDPHFALYMKYVYIAAVLYYPVVLFCNLSIIALYRRVFATAQFTGMYLFMVALTILWFLPGFFGELFSCTPIRYFWNPQIKGHCIYYSTFWLVMTVIETLIDVALFIIPLLSIRKLQLHRWKKVLLGFVFSLGGLSIITNICRMAESYEGRHISFINLGTDSVWLNVHLGTAILSACLPTLRFLVSKAYTTVSSLRGSKSGTKGSSNMGGSGSQSGVNMPSKNSRYDEIQGGRSEEKIQMTDSATWIEHSPSKENQRSVDIRTPREVV